MSVINYLRCETCCQPLTVSEIKVTNECDLFVYVKPCPHCAKAADEAQKGGGG